MMNNLSKMIKTILEGEIEDQNIDVGKLSNKFINNKELEEESLAQDLGVEVALLRKLLYKLHKQGVVSFRTTPNPEIQGRSIVYWRLNKAKIRGIFNKRALKVKEVLLARLEFESQNMIYECANNYTHARLPISEAMSLNFICPVCGARLKPSDTEHIISKIKMLVSSLNKVK